MTLLTVGDHRFVHGDEGAGTPVICIHGTLDDLRTWNRQIAPFAGRHRTVAYSRRWHWPNSAGEPDARYRAVDHRDDLIAFIEALGAGPAHLVGASYGAIVAMLAAAKRSDLVRSLTLGEPPLFTVLGRAAVEAHGARTIIPAREAYDRGDPAAGIALFLEAITGAGSFSKFPEAARAAALENSYEFGREVHSSIEDYFGPLTATDIGGIRAPALLVRGERSPKIFGDTLDLLAATLPNAQRLLVPGASHGMHRHNASVYNAAVLEFVADTESK